MRLFERFVETLQHRPEFTYGGSIEIAGAKTQLSNKGQDNTWIKHEILAKVEDCHIFVLTMNAIFTMSDDKHPLEVRQISEHKAEERAGYLDTELDLDVAPPFKTCWFQFAEPGHDLFSGVVDKAAGFKIYGMFLHELSPHEYLFCFVMQDANDPALHRYRYGHATMTEKTHDVWHTIALWLQPFGKGSTCGTMKTSTRVKFKHPVTGQKVLHKIRKVVMVYPRKMTPEQEAAAESDGVDFSHRWQVRGHWRKVAGIGKNREEEYVVSGYTFVREHEKGPEHLPLIKKTRVVLGEKRED